MEHLSQFNTLIQLITAINFANIRFHFHDKAFDVLFNEDAAYKRRYRNELSDIEADSSSLSTTPEKYSASGDSNTTIKNFLQNQIANTRQQLSTESEIITTRIKAVKNAKWIKSLFLFISLYCIYDLFLIALIDSKVECSFFFSILNFITSLACFWFIYKIIRQNDTRPDASLYKITIFISIGTLVSSLLICGTLNKLLYQNDTFLNVEWNHTFLSYISIFLPFVPYILCSLYLAIHEVIIKRDADDRIAPIISDYDAIHKLKIRMDKTFTNDTCPTSEPASEIKFK